MKIRLLCEACIKPQSVTIVRGEVICVKCGAEIEFVLKESPEDAKEES